jgi:selenocysteine-specific elongation factor
MKSVIIGTAGHIDHGKTSLVKVLTGIDADRLEEEKRRGITIDIGFAHLELAAANGEILRLGFVDVPGHERFVRNMLAGVGGIDLVILVIAADEGIKPQTREHFDICRLLAIRRGITVLTKSDAVDADTLEVARLEVEDFVRGSFLDTAISPIVPVSSLTGAGLDALRLALVKAAGEVPGKDSTALARLPIDRVFTMKGFGTVITGTLVSGTIAKEEELEVFPAGTRLRVRGVQVHGSAAERAIAGQRTALNLAAVTTDDLARGMTLAPPETFQSTSRVDVSLSLLASAKMLKDRARVHFHAYTMETIAEVHLFGAKQIAPGEKAYARLKLAEPTLLLPGDRFILRQFSPVVTIGGGVVLDAAPYLDTKEIQNLKKRGAVPIDTLLPMWEIFASGRQGAILTARVGRRGKRGLSVAEATQETGWHPRQVKEYVDQLVQNQLLLRLENRLFADYEFELARMNLVDAVSDFHKEHPLNAGMTKGELESEMRTIFAMAPELFEAALVYQVGERKLEVAGEIVHLPGRGVVMKDEESESKQIIDQAFAVAGLKVPSLKEVLAGLKVDKVRAQKIVTLLLREKVLVKISDDLVFHQRALAELRRKIVALKSATPKIDVARFKELTGVSRKYAIPLLEYLDRERVTRRVEDERIIL